MTIMHGKEIKKGKCDIYIYIYSFQDVFVSQVNVCCYFLREGNANKRKMWSIGSDL